MKGNPQMHYPKTVAAAQVSEQSAWGVVDALAAEADVSDEHGSAKALFDDLNEHGLEWDYDKTRRIVRAACFMAASTPRQQKLFRAKSSVTAISRVAIAGYSPEAIEAEIRSATDLTDRKAQELAATARGSRPKPERSIEDRCLAWVNKLNAVMVEGARLADEAEAVGENATSNLVAHLYRQFAERKFDVEVRQLLESEAAR